jgi:GGDEF domain-containing protein
MGRPLLYAAAGVLVLAALGLWARDHREERRREERRTARAEAAAEEDELEALGISDIRPREQEAETPDAETPDAETPDAASDEAPAAEETRPSPEAESSAPTSTPTSTPTEEEPGPAAAPEPTSAPEPPADAGQAPPSRDDDAEAAFSRPASEEGRAAAASSDASPDEPATEDALTALVRAARLAVGARAACLIAQDEWALEYRLEAVDAAADAPPLCAPGTTFSTDAPLLSAHAADRPVTRRSVGGSDDGGGGNDGEGDHCPPALLGYYRQLPPAAAPDAVLLAPVPRPDDPTTYFLLLDDAPDALAGPDALIERFARLVSQLLAAPDGGRAGAETPSPAVSSASRPAPSADAPTESDATGESAKGDSETEASATGEPPAENGRAASASQESASQESASQDEPRPRREIVAEEMERAHADGRAMTLALIQLNRAETITDRGEEERHAAERALKARLRQAIPDDGGRVERFGEMITYGVFLPYGSTEAERWAVALQEELAAASDPLEGGVSVGLALMRSPEQDPQALREIATEALREAYTTGTCTIYE